MFAFAAGVENQAHAISEHAALVLPWCTVLNALLLLLLLRGRGRCQVPPAALAVQVCARLVC
jgi:hypothetical protein